VPNRQLKPTGTSLKVGLKDTLAGAQKVPLGVVKVKSAV